MHEAGLMASALELARAEALRAGGGSIRRLVLRVGAYSGVEPEALRFAFEAMSGADASTAGASLELEEVPARCRCSDCGSEFAPAGAAFACPACGAAGGEWLAGRELELARLEVELDGDEDEGGAPW